MSAAVRASLTEVSRGFSQSLLGQCLDFTTAAWSHIHSNSFFGPKIREFYLLGYNACSLLKAKRLFGRTCRLNFKGRRLSQARYQHEATCFIALSILAYSSTLKMEAIYYPERSVDFQRITRCYIPEERTLDNHRCENGKSYTPTFEAVLYNLRYPQSRKINQSKGLCTTDLDRSWCLRLIRRLITDAVWSRRRNFARRNSWLTYMVRLNYPNQQWFRLSFQDTTWQPSSFTFSPLCYKKRAEPDALQTDRGVWVGRYGLDSDYMSLDWQTVRRLSHARRYEGMLTRCGRLGLALTG
jgi:hypothetical protein